MSVGEETRVRRPALRYPGGKWVLAPWILGHVPPHQVYTEAFGGAGSVLLRKPRSRIEIWDDLDGEIVNFFAVLRGPRAEELVRLLALTPYGREEFEAAYEPAEDPVERARRTAVLAGMGFSGWGAVGGRTGFRDSAKCKRSTHPAWDWRNYPASLGVVIERLRGVVIESRPADLVLRTYDGPATLHFVDPPYSRGVRFIRWASDSQYRHEMSDGDHRELAGVLRSLRGMVVLCGYPCELYDAELYPDWYRVERGALAEGARARREVLWLNPAAAERQNGRLDL